MVSFLSDHLLILVMLLNFALLSTGRLTLAVRLATAQGVLLGLLPGILHPLTWHLMTIIVGIILVKGIIIPWLLMSALKKAEIKRELEPFLGFGPTLVVGATVTALAFLYVPRLPLLAAHQGHLFVPASIATLLTGFLLLTTRRKAISQVLGYLILENGIFIFGLLLAEAMPVMVEAGVLLDLLAGIFVMGIVIGHISREFSSLDTSRLSALREK
ncbi:hydrogenase [Trichlorobacter ammonificans]|uniref:Ech-hydrogenase-related complex, HyfE-like integral membrane subunit n=1 Tax=Trichlorobacter ammonificans TaxID=2916410 RepID=A0ABM9D5E0_9BACT|nr:hydrogenase [Trichlorobacter ammonificans]CAH2030450.1 Ech-hydrogenase-related complex, HyfE-like integral membrane subunit [Trichlorobacter ammonificans]